MPLNDAAVSDLLPRIRGRIRERRRELEVAILARIVRLNAGPINAGTLDDCAADIVELLNLSSAQIKQLRGVRP